MEPEYAEPGEDAYSSLKNEHQLYGGAYLVPMAQAGGYAIPLASGHDDEPNYDTPQFKVQGRHVYLVPGQVVSEYDLADDAAGNTYDSVADDDDEPTYSLASQGDGYLEVGLDDEPDAHQPKALLANSQV